MYAQRSFKHILLPWFILKALAGWFHFPTLLRAREVQSHAQAHRARKQGKWVMLSDPQSSKLMLFALRYWS